MVYCIRLIGLSALAIACVLTTSHAVGGKREDMLANAYKECDKLLVIPPPGGNLSEFYQSAGRVSQCKDKKYEEIFSDAQSAFQLPVTASNYFEWHTHNLSLAPVETCLLD